MSLTTGRGPLSANPAGRFSAPVPDGVVYVEPFRRRVRAVVAGRTVADTEQVLLVHRPGQPPTYAFPASDVRELPTEPEAAVPGHVRVPWDVVDAWYEEEERMAGHPRNPYHRIDCLTTTRRLRVEVAGHVLVDTDRTVMLSETALDPRLYVAREHVRMDVLRPSETTTYCPYKGRAGYWTAVVGSTTVEDVAWSYEDPLAESAAIRGLLSFDDTRASVVSDIPPVPSGFGG